MSGPTITRGISWRGHVLLLSVDFDGSGRAQAVRTPCGAPHLAAETQAQLGDSCVLISMLLRRGVAPAAVAAELGRSLAGEVARTVRQTEAESGEVAREVAALRRDGAAEPRP